MDPDAGAGGGGEVLDLNLSLQPPEPERPGYFICSYCGKKFCSPQAFGGHQNAHKFERSVTKRALELAAARRDDGRSSHQTIKASPEANRATLAAEDMDLSLKL